MQLDKHHTSQGALTLPEAVENRHHHCPIHSYQLALAFTKPERRRCRAKLRRVTDLKSDVKLKIEIY